MNEYSQILLAIQGNGKTAKCMERGAMSFLMGVFMRGSIGMIDEMEMG